MKHHIAPSYVLSAILLAAMLSVANAQQPSAAGQERGAAQSNNHRWMEMDKNGDGKLTVDETTGLMKTFFKRVDENEDGFLDKVELDALAARLRKAENVARKNHVTIIPTSGRRCRPKRARSRHPRV